MYGLRSVIIPGYLCFSFHLTVYFSIILLVFIRCWFMTLTMELIVAMISKCISMQSWIDWNCWHPLHLELWHIWFSKWIQILRKFSSIDIQSISAMDNVLNVFFKHSINRSVFKNRRAINIQFDGYGKSKTINRNDAAQEFLIQLLLNH